MTSLVLRLLLSVRVVGASMFGSYSFWGFAQNIVDCLPGVNSFVETVRRLPRVKTDLGRGRAFLCAALTQGLIHEFINALLFSDLKLRYPHHFPLCTGVGALGVRRF